MKKNSIENLSTEKLVHIWKVWYRKKMTKKEEDIFKKICREYKKRTGNNFPKKPGKSR